jgi:RNA-dependent RNA polymerase
MDNIPTGPSGGRGLYLARQQVASRNNREYLTRPPSRWRTRNHFTSSTSRGRNYLSSSSTNGNSNQPLTAGFTTSLSGLTLKPRESWQYWPELTVRVQNLPPTITTSDLWRRFEQEGNIVFIELYENRQGIRDGNAKIRFQPPPRRDFWTADNIKISTNDGQGGFEVRVVAEPKKRRYEVQSPVRKAVWYPEILMLCASALSFGVLSEPTTMLNMFTTDSYKRDVKFSVDMLRNKIVAYFSVTFKQPAAENDQRVGRMDRVNQFKFSIPFAQLQKISQVNIDESQFALVITLDSPPQFFRKRLNLSNSHSGEALTWSESDCWFRQTDVVYDPRQVKGTVVALNTEVAPIIDLGEFLWTYLRPVFSSPQVVGRHIASFSVRIAMRQRFSK